MNIYGVSVLQYDIVATPALGGRFDQTIASINMLYMLKDDIERRFILVSDENLTMLLDKVGFDTRINTIEIVCLHLFSL